jgi:acyl-CoA thioesterase-1
MMGSDMNLMDKTRREWLADFTALALAASCVLSSTALAQTPAQTAAKPNGKTILVVGDSLSAEYGLKRGSGWVALMSARVAERKIAGNVVNASISGDTTSGGRSRLPSLLKLHQPSIVIIELGANDALRGLPTTMTYDNLDAMTKAAKTAGAKVVIVGMQVPPNYGRRYTDDFAATFPRVAKADGASLVPFMLKGVADVADSEALFQADRFHPKEAAHPTILGNIWPVVEPLLR